MLDKKPQSNHSISIDSFFDFFLPLLLFSLLVSSMTSSTTSHLHPTSNPHRQLTVEEAKRYEWAEVPRHHIATTDIPTEMLTSRNQLADLLRMLESFPKPWMQSHANAIFILSNNLNIQTHMICKLEENARNAVGLCGHHVSLKRSITCTWPVNHRQMGIVARRLSQPLSAPKQIQPRPLGVATASAVGTVDPKRQRDTGNAGDEEREEGEQPGAPVAKRQRSAEGSAVVVV
jgi:hypothetical protein